MAGRPWHRDDPQLLEELVRRVEAAYPELHVIAQGDTIVIKGWFHLEEGGRVIDRYRIEIELPRTYPRGLPVVREVGGRIPRSKERHIEENGNACLLVRDEFWNENPYGMDILDFLKGPVLGFFVGQALVERGQQWPFGTRGHAGKGIIEYYEEALRTRDPRVIVRFLEALSVEKLPGHWSCPCGSGRQLSTCHRQFIIVLRSRIPRDVAKASLAQVKQSLLESSEKGER